MAEDSGLENVEFTPEEQRKMDGEIKKAQEESKNLPPVNKEEETPPVRKLFRKGALEIEEKLAERQIRESTIQKEIKRAQAEASKNANFMPSGTKDRLNKAIADQLPSKNPQPL
jgi:hypothetical protein